MTTLNVNWFSVLAVVVGLAMGCAPEQWVIVVTTDARVPQFGDQAMVEIFDVAGNLACSSCRRQIAAGSSEQWPISFGIWPAAVSKSGELHVRARLFRSDHVAEEDGQPKAFLDAVGSLPLLAERGATRAHLHLAMACFGVASELTPGAIQTCDPRTGLLAPETALPTLAAGDPLPLSDSWQPGRQQDCPTAAPPGMACVPGGAFVLGGVHFNNLGPKLAISHERLVILRPFFMDVREFTAQDLALLRRDPRNAGLPLPTSATDIPLLCTATNLDSDKNNPFPINCISRDNAARICAAQGKRLPREAEWEYAAGNGQAENTYPWGDGDPRQVCQHAVVARGYLYPEDFWLLGDQFDCRVRGDGALLPPFYSPVCSDAVNKVWPDCAQVHLHELNRFGIQDLAGNLSEWIADDFASYDHPCWQPAVPGRNWLDNPQCHNPAAGTQRVQRGGSWQFPPNQAQVPSRAVIPRDVIVVNNMELQGSFGIGFRCVKDF